MDKIRCGWCLKDALYQQYHDEEWGVPVHDDYKMFEFLVLETFQAGLSWYTILKKREHFKTAFFDFNPEKMARIDELYFQKLMQNEGIVRNAAKIRAAIHNAKLFLEIMEKQSFAEFLWGFTQGKILRNDIRLLSDLPATSKESDAMSAELRKMGFKFVGSTVCYAHMQATGMVNDHLESCFRYKELSSRPTE